MLTGHQVREACSILGWTRYDLNRRTALPLWSVDRVITTQGNLDVTSGETTILIDAFDRAGIEFVVAYDGSSFARMREPPPAKRIF